MFHIFHDWEVVTFTGKNMVEIGYNFGVQISRRPCVDYYVSCVCKKCGKIKYFSGELSELPTKIKAQMFLRSKK